MTPELSLVIPTFNEAENVPILLERIAQALGSLEGRYEVLIVDDDSPDGTWRVAEACRERYPQLRVIRRVEGERGLAPSVVDGWRQARGELLGVIDADLQHPPEVLVPLLLAMRQTDAEIGVASRYASSEQKLRWNVLRKWLSRGASELAEAVLPAHARSVTDPLSGFFLLRRTVVEGITLRARGYKILLEVLSRGRYQRVVEVPYTFGRRHQGASKLSAHVMGDYLAQLWRLIWRPTGFGRFVRYCLVGSSGVLINLTVLWLLRNHETLGKLRAPALAIEASVLNNFLWNELWTFSDRARLAPRLRNRLQRLLSFNLVCVAGAGIHLGLVWLLAIHGHWPYMATNVLGILIVTCWNYGLNVTRTWQQHPAHAIMVHEQPQQFLGTLIRHRDRLITGTILLVALALRLWQLGAKSLWLDEASSWVFARQPLGQILMNVQEPNPPLYYALLHGWIALFGQSETALRMLSVLFGTLAVWLTYWVGRQLGGKPLGWIAMSLMAVMPMPIDYSQMARTYTLFLAASLGSFGCLLAWEATRARRWAVGYVAASIAMCYAHNYWVFNLAAQQLYMAWRIAGRQVPLRAWLRLSAGVLAGIAPWLTALVAQTLRAQQVGLMIPRPGLTELVEIPLRFATPWGIPQAAWAYLLLAVLGLALCIRRRTADGLLLLWLVCPIVLPFVASLIGTPMLRLRYAIAALPALYLLMGRGVLVLPGRLSRAAVVTVLLALPVLGLQGYYGWEREDWRTLAAEMERLVKPDDILVVSSTRPDPMMYYYKGPVPFTVPFETIPPAADTDRRAMQQLHDRIDGLITGRNKRVRVWVAVRLGFGRDFRPVITDALQDRYPGLRRIYKRRFSSNLIVYGYELGSRPWWRLLG